MKFTIPQKITFIISSVIYFPEKKLSYSDTRSIFSPEERAAHTEKTINSIKEKIPSVKIVLIEIGTNKKLPFDLDKKVDSYIYLGDKKLIRLACDSKYKGLGEAICLLYARKKIYNKSNFYFKISGRYYLADNFNIENWNFKKFNFKKYGKDISTRLYGFPSEMFNTWSRALLRSIPLLLRGYCIEGAMPRFIPDKSISEIDPIGIAGKAAEDASLVRE